MEKNIREKTQEASFGHVKLEMSRRLSESLYGGALYLWSSRLSDGHLLLAKKHLKFDISKLNSFLPPHICNTSCVHHLSKRYHHPIRLKPDPWKISISTPNTQQISHLLSQYPCPFPRHTPLPEKLLLIFQALV